MNASNKTTASMRHPQRWNVTTSMVGIKNSYIHKNLTQNGISHRYSWEYRREEEKFKNLCKTIRPDFNY